jgi:hypothetical protein
MSVVHQYLPHHVCTSGSQLGSSQCHPEEGRVSLGVHSMLLQQRNIILEVNNKSIIMFFKKGLRDLALIRKFTMKNLKMSGAMFTITNRYALAEEATLDTRV